VAALPEAAAPVPNGVAAQAPTGPATQWIVLGPRTRANLAAVAERQLAAVWVALLETSGVPGEQPYQLVVDSAHLEPVPPAPPPAPGPAPGG